MLKTELLKSNVQVSKKCFLFEYIYIYIYINFEYMTMILFTYNWILSKTLKIYKRFSGNLTLM